MWVRGSYPIANNRSSSNDKKINLTKYPERLLELIDYTPISVDIIIKKSGLTPEIVSSMLVMLEMAGRVICDINGLYSRSTTDGKQ
jgi:DNA processing protein